jgi:hypothetical protein
VNAPSLPLKAYEDLKSFKLFLVDVGLLSVYGAPEQSTLLDGNDLFKEFKGALTEQYDIAAAQNHQGPGNLLLDE